MAIKESGVISVSSLASEFGDGQPFSLSEYYRGGGLVPEDIQDVSSIREPTSGYKWVCIYTGDWTWGETNYFWAVGHAWKNDVGYYDPSGLEISGWPPYPTASAEIFTGLVNGAAEDVLTWTRGEYTYRRGEWVAKGYDNSPYWNFAQCDYYNIYRTQDTYTSVPGNEEVPSSGTLSLSDFYGASS